MANFVQLYRSTDAGTTPPVLSGTVGSMNALLQAVLVDGYATASVTSIVESGLTYSTTTSGAHGFVTGNYATISGASPAGANGVFMVTVTGANTFDYTGPGSLGTITGTILWRKAPLGWTNAFATATNVATFRPQSVTGRTNQFYLRVDDNGSNVTPSYRECQVRGYVTMSDKDTGTEPFPTVAQMAAPGLVWRKSTSLDATARPWTIIGDGATFYMVINSDNSLTAGRWLLGFGGHLTDTVGDAYNSFITGAKTSNSASPTVGNGTLSTVSSLCNSTVWATCYSPRSYTQLGTAVTTGGVQAWGTNTATPSALSQLSGAPFANPHGVDGGLYVGPILCAQDGLNIRGKFPGLYGHMHSTLPFSAEGDQITNVAGLSGITLRYIPVASVSTAGSALFDEFGPW